MREECLPALCYVWETHDGGMSACLMLCAGEMREECLPALCYVQKTYEGGVTACLM